MPLGVNLGLSVPHIVIFLNNTFYCSFVNAFRFVIITLEGVNMNSVEEFAEPKWTVEYPVKHSIYAANIKHNVGKISEQKNKKTKKEEAP